MYHAVLVREDADDIGATFDLQPPGRIRTVKPGAVRGRAGHVGSVTIDAAKLEAFSRLMLDLPSNGEALA